MKKKIIFFCPAIGTGGVEKNLYKIVNFFAIKNQIVYLVTFRKNNIQKKFHKNVRIIDSFFFGNFPLPNFMKILFCYLNYFWKFGFRKNLLFVSFQSNLFFILLAKFTQNKIIARSNAAPNYYISNRFKKKIFQTIYKMADKVIVNSKEFKKIFVKTFKVNPIVIYNPAYNKKDKLKFKDVTKKNIIFFLNVARLTDQKNHIIMLKAFKEIKNINYKLKIIGNGYEENNLKQYILKNNLQNNIQIIKNISNSINYLKKCDAFILTSKFEGLPNVLIEAQIMKKFIISSNCPTGPKEILMNGDAGYLFNNNNYKDLKKNIIRFIKKKNSVEIKNKIKIGYKNLYRFEEKTNLEKYYKEIINL